MRAASDFVFAGFSSDLWFRTISVSGRTAAVTSSSSEYPYKGDIVIPEDGAVSFKLYASAATDINYTFDLRTGR